MTPVTLPLAEPVKVGTSDPITQLVLRPPRGKDILDAGGMPIEVLGDFRINVGPMRQMIALLSDLPASTVDLLSFTDWSMAAGVVAGFLRPAGAAANPAPGSPS